MKWICVSSLIVILYFLSKGLSAYGQADAKKHPEYQKFESGALPQKPLNIAKIEDTAHLKTLINDAAIITGDNTDSAIFILQITKKWSERQKYSKGIALSLLHLSTAWSVLNDPALARRSLEEARYFCQRSEDSTALLMKWQWNLALYHNYRGYTDSAIAALQPIRERLSSVTDTHFLSQYYTLYSAILISNHDYEAAFPYLEKSKALIDKESAGMIVNLLNFAFVYSSRRDTANLYFHANKAYELARKVNRPKYERSASVLLMEYYRIKGDSVHMITFAENAIRLLDKERIDDHVRVYNQVASIVYRSGDYKRTLEYGSRALSYVRPDQLPRKDIVPLFKTLAFAYDELGYKDSAFSYLLIYNNLNDSLNFLERNRTIDKIESQFQLAEKDREILLQEARVRNRNFGLLLSGFVLVIVLFLLVLMWNFYRNSKRRLLFIKSSKQVDELKAVLEGEEKERKRIARELHDGMGGLLSAAIHNLEALGQEQVPARQSEVYHQAVELIKKTNQEIRRSAHNLMPDVLLKNNLQDAVYLFCSYMKQNEGLDIIVQTNGDFTAIDDQLKLSIYRIIQELVQNIVKHARATSAFVQLQKINNLITITVEDDGLGFDVGNTRSGMGLNSIRDRVRTFKGELSIMSNREKGSSVYIAFELE